MEVGTANNDNDERNVVKLKFCEAELKKNSVDAGNHSEHINKASTNNTNEQRELLATVPGVVFYECSAGM